MGKMRLFIFSGEHPANLQHVRTVVDSLDDDDEYVLCVGKKFPTKETFEYNRGLVGFLQRVSAKLGYSKNNFVSEDYEWEWRSKSRKQDWKQLCKPIKSNLPWTPDLVIVVTPNQGHTKSHIVPWCNINCIPVVSIDHGMPTVRWPWLDYRGSMMGCDANAVWSEVNREINIEVGAPKNLQIITGSPSIDMIAEDNGLDPREELGISEGRKIILLLGSHRAEIKQSNDRVFRKIIDTYSTNSQFSIVYKPHPVEMSNSEELKVPRTVVVTTSQELYIPLIRSAHAIISTPTSVITPALAFYRPFVNTLSRDCGVVSGDEVEKLENLLGSAVFPISKVHEVIMGTTTVNHNACDEAFERFGYKRDGRNGERVASLSRWIADGGAPADWEDKID